MAEERAVAEEEEGAAAAALLLPGLTSPEPTSRANAALAACTCPLASAKAE